MKKAVVFTMDAVIALAIFIASLVFFARFFTDTTFTGISDINIYSQSDNFLATIDGNNSQLDVYSNYINNNSNDQLLADILSTNSYQANIRFYLYNGSEMEEIASYEPHEFPQKLILRRFIIYSGPIEEPTFSASNVSISSVQSGFANSTLVAKLDIYNPGPNNWTGITGSADVTTMSWTVTPSFFNVPNLAPGQSYRTEFNISAPEDAAAGSYVFETSVTYWDGPLLMGAGYDNRTFHILRFGIAELEVGLES